MKDNLLIELGTEELPPKALASLSDAFCLTTADKIRACEFNFTNIVKYATPRRLAVVIKNLQSQQADRTEHLRGPAVAIAFDKNGAPTKAAHGFARSCGVEVAALGRIKNDQGEWLAFDRKIAGRKIDDALPRILSDTLTELPIPKRMRWGNRQVEFVRPAHWLVVLYGDRVVDCEVLELHSGRITRGHRFHHGEPISLAHADEYESKLEDPGYVICDFSKRRQRISELAKVCCAHEHENNVSVNPKLLDEVTALVEWPAAVGGSFDERFLKLPPEVLIASMQDHQKYFPVLDGECNLRNRFVAISNIDSSNPDVLRSGNERVLRPRLGDAEFFWEVDRTKRLEDRFDSLANMVFEKRLGSLLDKTRRVECLVEHFAKTFSAEKTTAARAAHLARCDLISEMVGEFPSLQGTIGRYYAEADGEETAVCVALGEFYKPRYADDSRPESSVGACVAFSDRLDTLVGIFGIGSTPTGDKDPYALRRTAIGLLRILIEGEIDLDLRSAIDIALQSYGNIELLENTSNSVFTFVHERMRGYFLDRGILPDVCSAVFVNNPSVPAETARRLNAVRKFRETKSAVALSKANKRIANILKKLETAPDRTISKQLLVEPEERALVSQYEALSDRAEDLFERHSYSEYMELLSTLQEPVDAFFNNVMVMCEDKHLRANRLSLLSYLHDLFTRVADISYLHNP